MNQSKYPGEMLDSRHTYSLFTTRGAFDALISKTIPEFEKNLESKIQADFLKGE